MNDLIKTMQTLWSGLTGPQKVSIIGSVLAVCAVLIAVIYLSSKPVYEALYANLPPTEVAKVIDFLEEKSVNYQLENGGQTVMVPAGKVHELRIDMAAEGIPSRADAAGGVGLELLDKSTFGQSDLVQRANLKRAIQGELARTISQIDGVEEARVNIVVPEERLFRANRREPKASVLLKLRSRERLPSSKVRAIQFLVANSVEGLQAERVAVVDNYGRALAENEIQSDIQAATENQLSYIQDKEEYLREKAQSMLDRALGWGQAEVRVAAEVDFDALQQTSETFDPSATVIRSESTTSENSKSETITRGGGVGTVPNTETGDFGTGTPTRSEQERASNTNQYEVSRTVSTLQKATGSIKRLSVAVFLNMRSKLVEQPDGSKETNYIKRDANELKEIEEIVRQAVGFTQGDERKDSITVVEVPFADPFADKKDEGMAAGILQEITTLSNYFPYASQIFLVLLAIAVYFYFRSLLKGPGRDESEGAFADLIRRFEDMENEEPIFAQRAAEMDREEEEEKERAKRDPAFRTEELGQLIRDNPDNTTQAIKKWLKEES